MILSYLTMKYLGYKAKEFEDSTKDVLQAQKKVLFEYLERNKNTEYGKRFNFSKIKSIEEFQKTLPLCDYEMLYPYIDRMARGERGILTADKPIFFGRTSGTTNISKLIPVTKYSRDKKSEETSLWAYYVWRDHPGVLSGKIMAVISPEIEGFTPAGIPYGAESGHGYRNLPSHIKRLYALPYEIFDIKDYDARYYTILRIGIEQDVTTLATLNPSALVLLCQKIEKWGGEIIEDIEKGSISGKFDIDDKLRNIIGGKLRPNPKRAAELKKIVADKKELLPKDFWPNLKVIECWKGGTVKLYLKELPRYFGDTPLRDFGCLSTEARSSLPMSDRGAGSVLTVTTNFYEFVPREEMSGPGRRFLLCNQLEAGKEYFIIVTTAGGLYRYNIDDVIKVNGFFNQAPVIEFVQKGLNAVSVTGEKVYESQVNEAVNKALEKYKASIEFFSASVQLDHPARYIFLIEFNDPQPPEGKKKLLSLIESEMHIQNSEYKYLREAQLLGTPILKVVKKGAFEKYRAKKIAQGAHDGQFKIPELVGDFDFQKNFDIEEEILL